MPHHLEKFIGKAALGAALLMTCLQAGAASALSFNFSFSGVGYPNDPTSVTGIVDGLVDNQANQTTGLTFTISSATNTPTSGYSTFSNYIIGDGIDVFGGQVTGADVYYENLSVDGLWQALLLGNKGRFPSVLVSDGLAGEASYYENYEPDSTSANSLRFTPTSSASVPGPLPLFGIAAAFAWSRRLRRRIKS